MQSIANFLRQSRRLLSSKDPACLVIGNESCDLDSVVCALSLAFFYQSFPQRALKSKHKQFLPILNIHRCDYALKTEVTFLLKKYQINAEDLTFRDELSEEMISISEVILVDHHVSPFAASCIEVYDHRQFDSKSNLPEACKLRLETVGSCATLIAEQIYVNLSNDDAVHRKYMLPVAEMLRSTIILDTANFDDKAQRYNETDKKMFEALEKYIGEMAASESRSKIFETLVKARADVSALTSEQLLRKDMKIISSRDETMRIALCGFPLLAREFVCSSDASETVCNFAKSNKCCIIMLIGMLVIANGEITRDIGFINIKAEVDFYDKIINSLVNSEEPNFELKQISELTFLNGKFFKQNNIRATRKHMIPIISKAAGLQ